MQIETAVDSDEVSIVCNQQELAAIVCGLGVYKSDYEGTHGSSTLVKTADKLLDTLSGFVKD